MFPINLDSAVERRSLMTQQLEACDLSFERVGIDFLIEPFLGEASKRSGSKIAVLRRT